MYEWIIQKGQTQLIVTLAASTHPGENIFLEEWNQFCRPGWTQYAQKFGFDLLVITQPLDQSSRGLSRNLSWQKCLIPALPELQRYNQVVWIDSDILINPMTSPEVTAEVPIDKIGATDAYSFMGRLLHDHLYQMYQEYCQSIDKKLIINPSPESYYQNFGLPDPPDQVAQCGVMVFNPLLHAPIFTHVYETYEEKTDPDTGYAYNYEMRPLSYYIVRHGYFHELDQRYNLLFNNYAFLSSPWMAYRHDQLEATERIRLATSAYVHSYFLHFAGGYFGKAWMKDVCPEVFTLTDFQKFNL